MQSHLNAKNFIQAINTIAISVLHYSGGLIRWTKEDLRGLDVLTRKQLTLHRSFHIKGDVDRLYVSRKTGGRGLLSVTETILGEEGNLMAYVASLSERLLQLVPAHIWFLVQNTNGKLYRIICCFDRQTIT